MNSVVSKRFIECLEKLKVDNRIKSCRQFALSLEYAPQSLSDIINGKREVTVELIRKASELYKINTNYLFTGSGELFINAAGKSGNTVLTVITNNQLEENIAYVPVSAQAGYGGQLYDQSFMEELPAFALPGRKYGGGTHRCFDISGDSMEPIFESGDQVICNFVELDKNFSNVKDNHVYVLVTEESVVVKRVVKNIESRIITLVSDNEFYEPYEVDLAEIKEVWQVVVKISEFSPSKGASRNDVQEEFHTLKHKINQQSQLIKSLNGSLELLLKRSRSVY
jgi:phage repressor protein C with HTH and peptisase S24 domain